MSLKEIFNKKCKFRIENFEQAQKIAKAKGVLLKFLRFDYYEESVFVCKAIGVVDEDGSSLRVEWNNCGLAFIGKKHVEKYDLILTI